MLSITTTEKNNETSVWAFVEIKPGNEIVLGAENVSLEIIEELTDCLRELTKILQDISAQQGIPPGEPKNIIKFPYRRRRK